MLQQSAQNRLAPEQDGPIPLLAPVPEAAPPALAAQWFTDRENLLADLINDLRREDHMRPLARRRGL